MRKGRFRRRIGPFLIVVLIGLVGAGVWASRSGLFESMMSDTPARVRDAYERRDYRTSAALAKSWLERAPREPEAVRFLARSTARQGDFETAMRLFARLDPQGFRSEDFYLMGAAMFSKNRLPDALPPWETSLSLDLRNVEALRSLIGAYRSLDRLEDSAVLAERLAELPGGEPFASVSLGLAADLFDQREASVRYWRKAMAQLSPWIDLPVSEAEARVALAKDLLRLGRPAEARAELGKLVGNACAEAAWLVGRSYLQESDPKASDSEAVRLAAAGRLSPGSADPLAFEPAPYVGSARCASCHASISRDQRKSRHAVTLADKGRLDRVSLPESGVVMKDPADSSVEHQIRRRDQDIEVVTRRLNGPELRAIVEFAVGSGYLATTLVTVDDRKRAHEYRISHYGHGAGWDVTTGHEWMPNDPDHWQGRPLRPDGFRRCLDCHSTRTVSALGGPGPEAAEGGIGCERCHGPGAHHIKAVQLGWTADLAIARPNLARGPALVGMCGRCHTPKHLNLDQRDPKAVRFQSTTMTWSECYRASRGKLDCLTCHDPHRDASKDTASYEAACLQCHDAKPNTVCSVNPSNGCISCHMPQVTNEYVHMTFTDHNIRIHETKAAQEKP